MDDTRTCPKCGAENAKSRLTCEVCGERLSAWQAKGTEKKTTEKVPKKKESAELEKAGKPTEDSKKNPEPSMPDSTIKDTKDTKDSKTTAPSEKKVIKRRKKRASPVLTEPVFFMLHEGKLTAVNVRLFVSKPIKTSDLPSNEGSLIAFVNRNKAILTG